MRKHLLILTILLSLFLAPATSHAGFIVKRKAETTVGVAAKNEEKTAKQERRQEVLQSILSLLPHDGDHDRKDCKRHDGWQGTASMWCAIGGFFYFPPALILALVWGGIGLKPGAKHQKRARAGVIIAIAGLFFWHLLITAAIWGL